MKEFLKKVVPAPVVKHVSAVRENSKIEALADEWERVRGELGAQSPAPFAGKIKNVMIVPTDPYFLIGSIGDDAMISATIDVVAEKNPGAKIYIITADEKADAVAARLGLSPFRIWSERNYCESLVKVLRSASIDSVVVLGADVIDGHYGALIAAKLIVSADLAARLGARSTVLGYSFNGNPAPQLRGFFNLLSESAELNIRELVSKERFEKFSSHSCKFVADSAFFLQPAKMSTGIVDVEAWVSERRAAGRMVVGLNLHPMLLGKPAKEEIDRLIHNAVRAVRVVSARHPVSWVLISHDYRENVGDDVCLVPMANRFAAEGNVDYFHVQGRHRAAALKRIAGQLDGVVTGRMHLAIGSLGMGTPVFVIKYQDKFEGLLKLFQLPQEVGIPAASVRDDDSFATSLEYFLGNMAEFRATVGESLPAVMRAAAGNFSVLQ